MGIMINQQRCRLVATQPRAGKPRYLSLRQILYTGALCFLSLIIITRTYQRPATHRRLTLGDCLQSVWQKVKCCLPSCCRSDTTGPSYGPLDETPPAPSPSSLTRTEQMELDEASLALAIRLHEEEHRDFVPPAATPTPNVAKSR